MALKISPFSAAFQRHIDVVEQSMQQMLPDVESAAKILVSALTKGKKILTCGNGGSAADSSHFIEELIGRYKENRASVPAVSLASDGVVLTVIANDFGYENIFSRQVEALGNSGDVLVVFSTSGASKNVLNAVDAARTKKMKIIALTGERGENMRGIADTTIVVPTKETARIQEVHELVYHAWCEYIDAKIFNV